MSEMVRAMVRVGASQMEMREYPMPDVPEDAALMKVVVAGICGTDVKMYKKPQKDEHVIMGHENIGYIAKARNSLVFQGDVESIAGRNPEALMLYFEQISGSEEFKRPYNMARQAAEEAEAKAIALHNSKTTIKKEMRITKKEKQEAEAAAKKAAEEKAAKEKAEQEALEKAK